MTAKKKTKAEKDAEAAAAAAAEEEEAQEAEEAEYDEEQEIRALLDAFELRIRVKRLRDAAGRSPREISALSELFERLSERIDSETAELENAYKQREHDRARAKKSRR